VRDDALEQDQRREDEQAEAEQAPVGGRAPDAPATVRDHGFPPDPWLLPAPFAGGSAVFVLSGGVAERPGDAARVVAVFV
jgi:hypothetical protein